METYNIDKLGDYQLNKQNIKKFIKESDDEVKPIVRKIIKNTKYIKFTEFMKELYKSVNDLLKCLKKNKKQVIYVYRTKEFDNKSNGWIYKYSRDMINFLEPNIKINLIDKEFKNVNNDDFIIFTDDCIYTGNQMRTNVREINQWCKKKVKIFILCPFMASDGINTLKDSIKNIKYENFNNNELIISKHKNIDKYMIDNFLNLKEMKLLKSYYGNLDLDVIINDDDDIYYTIFYGNYLLYFNHKLGDYLSTISLFYMGVVPNKYNKKIFEKRVEIGWKGLLKFQVIPLISNCGYNETNINVNRPVCPPQPYKSCKKCYI